MSISKRGVLPVLIIVFFAGFSFLIYEISWFRMLSLVLGATVSASTIVLIAFMAGFGFGAFYWGKFNDNERNPGKLLIKLLIVAGVLGFANYFLFNQILPQLYPRFQIVGLSATITNFLVYIISLLLLLLPAFFMGGILPVASAMIIRDDAEVSILIGRIYALETIGSTLGGLAAGFLLIGTFGQQITILIAVVINFALAVYISQSGYLKESAIHGDECNPEPAQQTKSKKKDATIDILPINQKAALIATFAFGFAVIGLQVVWFRIFRIYMTNTSYTFSLIASMVILGLFAGSWFYSKKGEKFRIDSYSLLKLLLITALFIFIGFLVLLRLPEFIMFPLAGKQEAYFTRIIIIPFLSALLVIIPVTFLSGYAFPLACTLYTKSYKEISSNVGRILVVNTAGSVAGPLLAAYLLIPVWGSGLSVIVFAFFMLIAAFLLARSIRSFQNTKTIQAAIAVAGIVILTVLVVNPTVYILPPSFTRFEKKILEYKETVEGTYVVGQESNGRNTVLSTYVNNSAVIGSSYDAIKVVKMVGHLPFFTGLECRKVLVVGFGIGVTTSAIASHPEVESIDCIELVAGLKDAAHYYSGLNNNIQNDKRLKVQSGDGRHYLQSTSKKYDLISSDPTHPILGSGNLYTREYFELCKAHLNPGGMVSQYLPLHKLLPEDFLGIIKTFHSVFPNATIWLGHYHAVLLGANGPLKVDFTKWTENISSAVKDPYFYTNPYHVAACLVLDSLQIEKFPANIKINTDDQPYAEFFRLSSFDADNLTINLNYLNQNRGGVNRVFHNIPEKAMMDRFINGNRLLTEGIFHDLQGNKNEFRNKLKAAVTANPEDEEFPFLLKFNFGR